MESLAFFSSILIPFERTGWEHSNSVIKYSVIALEGGTLSITVEGKYLGDNNNNRRFPMIHVCVCVCFMRRLLARSPVQRSLHNYRWFEFWFYFVSFHLIQYTIRVALSRWLRLLRFRAQRFNNSVCLFVHIDRLFWHFPLLACRYRWFRHQHDVC